MCTQLYCFFCCVSSRQLVSFGNVVRNIRLLFISRANFVVCLHDAEKLHMTVLCDTKCNVQTERLWHSPQEPHDVTPAIFSP